MPPTGPEFRPGFRLSTRDVVVLVVGALGAVAAAVAHFFLFCNVVRVARRPELAWSVTFLACALAQQKLGLPWPAAATIVAIATTTVVGRELRKPSYHGVLWKRINPDLPIWWSHQRPSA